MSNGIESDIKMHKPQDNEHQQKTSNIINARSRLKSKLKYLLFLLDKDKSLILKAVNNEPDSVKNKHVVTNLLGVHTLGIVKVNEANTSLGKSVGPIHRLFYAIKNILRKMTSNIALKEYFKNLNVKNQQANIENIFNGFYFQSDGNKFDEENTNPVFIDKNYVDKLIDRVWSYVKQITTKITKTKLEEISCQDDNIPVYLNNSHLKYNWLWYWAKRWSKVHIDPDSPGWNFDHDMTLPNRQEILFNHCINKLCQKGYESAWMKESELSKIIAMQQHFMNVSDVGADDNKTGIQIQAQGETFNNALNTDHILVGS